MTLRLCILLKMHMTAAAELIVAVQAIYIIMTLPMLLMYGLRSLLAQQLNMHFVTAAYMAAAAGLVNAMWASCVTATINIYDL